MDLRAIFSDVDGTIVHYEKNLVKQGYVLTVQPPPPKSDAAPFGGPDDALGLRRCQWLHVATGRVIDCFCVPSLTLGGGFVTVHTLQLVRCLRDELGVVFVLLTGARSSTMAMRRASRTLPETDFDCCEGGGKIHKLTYTDDLDAVAAHASAPISEAGSAQPISVTLDVDWCNRFASVIGPWTENEKEEDPLKRLGKLWDCYRSLAEGGKYKLDAKSFSTAFIVDFKARGDEAEKELKRRFEAEFLPVGIYAVMNLGKAHVGPVGCDKRTAVERICVREGWVDDDHAALAAFTRAHCMALFDDENDLSFAHACGKGFLPSVTHDSVLDALREDERIPLSERRWRRAAHDGLLGTEEALEYAIGLRRRFLATVVSRNAANTIGPKS